MDDKELSALKALAEAATPGPWQHNGRYIGVPNHLSYVGECRDENGNWSDTAKSRGDSAYIAAANPAAILSLISHVESADLLGEHYEKLCQSKDARIAELEADKEGWRKAAIGAAVDLSGLTRYGWTEAYCGDDADLIEHQDGTYVKFADVQAILATPARDVGRLTEVRNSVIEEVAKLMESSDDHIWANTCGRKIRALATSPAPNVKKEASDQALLAALITAEAALADIGDADREPGDDVAWCEARAAKALPKVRAAIAAAPAPSVTDGEGKGE